MSVRAGSNSTFMSACVNVFDFLRSCSVCRKTARSCAGPGDARTVKPQVSPGRGTSGTEHSRSPSPQPQRRKGMDSPTCLLQRKRREATTAQSLSAWLCHLVSHSTGGSWCPTAAPKRDETLCSQRCARAGKALYLNWREDFQGQERRAERKQLDKGQSGTVTLQKKYKRPCYSQKTKKQGLKKIKKENHRNTHTATTEISGSLLGEITSCMERGQALCVEGKAPRLARYQAHTVCGFLAHGLP